MKTNIAIFILTLSAGLWSSCSSNEPNSILQTAAIDVKIGYPMRFDSTAITVSGQLSAKNSAEISTRMMAYVEKVFVNPGDKVTAGQTLIQLNDNELRSQKKQILAQISTAELAAQNAEKDFQRFQVLHAEESVSDKELENMKLNKTSTAAQLQMAHQKLKEIKAMLNYTEIKAPFAGTVTQKNINEGSMAKPGMPLLVVEQRHDMEVTTTVPENEITSVTVGERVEVEVKALNRTFQGTISELSPSATLSGGQYAMKVAIDNKNDARLLTGMYAIVKLPRKAFNTASTHLLIDKSSVVKREQLRGVYVVNAENQAVLRWLRLGKTLGDQIEVLSGLNEKERIIVQAKGKLYNGRKVSIK